MNKHSYFREDSEDLQVKLDYPNHRLIVHHNQMFDNHLKLIN